MRKGRLQSVKIFPSVSDCQYVKNTIFSKCKKSWTFSFCQMTDDIILSKTPVVFKTSKIDQIPSVYQKLLILAKCRKSLQILAKYQNILCTGTANEALGGTMRIVNNPFMVMIYIYFFYCCSMY